MSESSAKKAMVGYLDEAREIECPYGNVKRVITGGAGGVANVHIVSVTKGTTHFHAGYDEVYYVLRGTGQILLGDKPHALRPGAVVVIPAGLSHSLDADAGQTLEFIIFGTPAMPIDDERAKPRKP
jgi:mannose-6-phosphate isomerase-like protein (cupin superfamily)